MTFHEEPAHSTADVRSRLVLTLALVAALVFGVSTPDAADLVALGSEPKVLHPVVTDGSGYLSNGYADGAHVLTLPGNMVGISADGTIAATRSTGGHIKGYRLSDGHVAWVAGGSQNPPALRCDSWTDPDVTLWWPNRGGGLAFCWREQPRPTYVTVDLATGALTDFGDLSRYADFKFVGLDDDSVILDVIALSRTSMQLVRIGPGGREIFAASIYQGQVDQEEWLRSGCRYSQSRAICSFGAEVPIAFDAENGSALAALAGERGSRARVTADGYFGGTWQPTGPAVFDEAGVRIGSGASCDFVPDKGVLYPNSDYQAQQAECVFKLVGPSGRVFAERPVGTSYCLLSQPAVKVPVSGGHGYSRAYLTRDEGVIALVPSSTEKDPSSDGARLFNAQTGELIESFPLPWALADNGIIYWTVGTRDPDNLLGTQVLVPGA